MLVAESAVTPAVARRIDQNDRPCLLELPEKVHTARSAVEEAHAGDRGLALQAAKDVNSGDAANRYADLVGRRLDAKAREVREPLVEWSVVPEVRLRASDARVARLDREACAFP